MTGGMLPDVSIIIVTWNVRDLVLDCLASLPAAAGDVRYETVLVDNASSDGTAAAVRARFPDVTVIANERNVGFPAANNQALPHARGRHVLYLNPDTVVHPGTLQACVAALDADPTIGMVGCRLVEADGRPQYVCARRTYRLRHFATEMLYLHMLFPESRVFGHYVIGEWDHRGVRDVEAISGAFMLVRRDVVDFVGGLPEDLFMYHEDASFCLRVLRAGWRIRYLGDHETTHLGGGSSSGSEARLDLLEGEYKIRLIREAQGPLAASAARVLFGIRSVLRLGVATLALPVPRENRLRRSYPKVFSLKRHALHLVWSVWPRAVRPLMPGKGGRS